MICRRCGAPINPQALFCETCGESYQDSKSAESAEPIVERIRRFGENAIDLLKQNKKRSMTIALAGVGLTAAIVCGIVLLNRHQAKDNLDASQHESSNISVQAASNQNDFEAAEESNNQSYLEDPENTSYETAGRDQQRVFDDAGLLKDDEEALIQARIGMMRDQHSTDVCVLTTNNTAGKRTNLFCADFFEAADMGMGIRKDGLLLCIDMENRQIMLITHGNTIGHIDTNREEAVYDVMYDYTVNGEYGEAFLAGLDRINTYLEKLPALPLAEDGDLNSLILQGDERQYTYADLTALTWDEVALLRNGQYALSGLIFRKAENVNYFNAKDWYDPLSDDPEIIYKRMNAYQKYNVDLCVEYEKTNGWR